jgi:hypothetical protein
MAEPPDDPTEERALNERLLNVFVYVPAGIAAAVAEEFPKLAARGRERLGVRVSSARSVGEFAVRAGQNEFRRRSQGLRRPGGPPKASPSGSPASPEDGAPDDHPSTPASGSVPSAPTVPTGPVAGGGHIPPVSTLSIPGFDTLSASQVVQRLDGLNRSELVAVRTYESATRGRRTILSRVDQLLDERS